MQRRAMLRNFGCMGIRYLACSVFPACSIFPLICKPWQYSVQFLPRCGQILAVVCAIFSFVSELQPLQRSTLANFRSKRCSFSICASILTGQFYSQPQFLLTPPPPSAYNRNFCTGGPVYLSIQVSLGSHRPFFILLPAVFLPAVVICSGGLPPFISLACDAFLSVLACPKLRPFLPFP